MVTSTLIPNNKPSSFSKMFVTALLGATIPTLFLVWLIWWADRYEREPTRLLVSAFFWGAIPAILLALITELILALPINETLIWGQLASVAVIAPIVEETVKGMALLGMLLFTRSELDGILDGIIYGALIGAGFAMTENFFYFLSEETLTSLRWLIFLRAGLFGWNHIFFTAIFGASVGAAAQIKSRWGQGILLMLGLATATSLHMLHNASTVLSQVSGLFLVFSTLMLWSGLAVFLIIIILLLARERRIIRDYLSQMTPKYLTDLERARLMAILPPLERLIPNVFLSKPAKRRAERYQLVAELAFRWHRLQKTKGAPSQAILQEMAILQQKLQGLYEEGA